MALFCKREAGGGAERREGSRGWCAGRGTQAIASAPGAVACGTMIGRSDRDDRIATRKATHRGVVRGFVRSDVGECRGGPQAVWPPELT